MTQEAIPLMLRSSGSGWAIREMGAVFTMGGALSGPLYPNAPSGLFCAFPRPASPTSSTYLVGCPSPM